MAIQWNLEMGEPLNNGHTGREAGILSTSCREVVPPLSLKVANVCIAGMLEPGANGIEQCVHLHRGCPLLRISKKYSICALELQFYYFPRNK